MKTTENTVRVNGGSAGTGFTIAKLVTGKRVKSITTGVGRQGNQKKLEEPFK